PVCWTALCSRRPLPGSRLFPYTTLFRSHAALVRKVARAAAAARRGGIAGIEGGAAGKWNVGFGRASVVLERPEHRVPGDVSRRVADDEAAIVRSAQVVTGRGERLPTAVGSGGSAAAVD